MVIAPQSSVKVFVLLQSAQNESDATVFVLHFGYGQQGHI
jgi:hypothetical protein